MRRINAEELKQIQLEILDVLVDFCDKNGIKYWLDSGTLLGAIRHNGYIPWDDDIDTGMLRPDFDRFIHEFNASNPRYKVYCIENNPEFYFVQAKVLDTYTTLYEPDEKGAKLSVNIDIFVYDNAPDDEKELKKAFDRRDFYRTCNILRTLNNRPSGNAFRRLYVRILRLMVKVHRKDYYCKKMLDNSKKYINQDTKRVGNFSSFSRVACNKRVFSSFDEHIFEGKMYKIPIGYDEWLRAFYNDYMQLPPEKDRVTHHKFIAYYNEK